MAKRLFDVIVSAAMLLVLWPLLLLVALLVKWDSPGPVFYRQERVGRREVPFRIHKFRTMRHGSGGLPITVGTDARVTRSGAFLRRTRLDELPQLFDVLVGHMSLVGPRPEVPRYVAHYPPELRAVALSIRPGMTDPASLSFIDEAALLAASPDPERTYIEQILPAKVAQAAGYAQHASVLSDLLVLGRTAGVLLARLFRPGGA